MSQPENSIPGPPQRDSDEKLDTLHRRLTDLSIFISLLAGFPIILFKVYEVFKDGFALSSWPTMAAYSIVGLLAFLRNSIHYKTRAGIAISLLFLVTVFGLSHYGFLLACFFASLIASLLSILILGKTNGMFFALFTCGMGMIVVFVMGNETLSVEMDSLRATEIITEWWPQIIAILAFYFSLALSISTFESSLKNTIRQLENQKGELQVLNNDLTRSRDLAKAANEAKSRFISVMSHELKSPLNPIFGILNLLREEPLNSKSKEYVDLMRDSSNRLLSLITDILEYVEADQEAQSTEMLPFPIRELCNSIEEPWRREAEAKGLAFFCNHGFGEECIDNLEIVSDPRKLKSVLDKLLSNAVKFTSHGHVTFSCKRSSAAEDRDCIEFAIGDTGEGISTEVRKSIFEPFFQGDAASTRQHGGIGLGLSIAFKNTNLLHGKITLDSEEGKGSTFLLRLPLINNSHTSPSGENQDRPVAAC
jgi:signal transduction histidine kinase